MVSRVASRASLSKAEAAAAVDGVLEAIQDALARGDSVALTGFGTFSVKSRPAHREEPGDGREHRDRRLDGAFLQGRQDPPRCGALAFRDVDNGQRPGSGTCGGVLVRPAPTSQPRSRRVNPSASVRSIGPLALVDLRGHGPNRIGDPSAIAHDGNHAAGGALSAAVHATVPEAEGRVEVLAPWRTGVNWN